MQNARSQILLFLTSRAGRLAALMETTLILLKPDCITGHKAGEVLKRFEDAGFQIRGCKMFRADAGLLREHYAHIAAMPFFPEVEAFMGATPIVALALAGDRSGILKKFRPQPARPRQPPSKLVPSSATKSRRLRRSRPAPPHHSPVAEF
jgi:hypothetical protein